MPRAETTALPSRSQLLVVAVPFAYSSMALLGFAGSLSSRSFAALYRNLDRLNVQRLVAHVAFGLLYGSRGPWKMGGELLPLPAKYFVRIEDLPERLLFGR